MSSPLATTPAAAPAHPTTTPPATTLPPVDLHNIQGDICPGLPKKFEAYWFIQIRDGQVNQFRTKLFKLLPLITSAAQAQRDQDQIDHYKGSPAFNGQLLKLSGVNIGFSHKGLVKLGIADPITNTTTDPFQTGMFNDIGNLNDQADKWLPDFKKDIHALIFITGESLATIHERYAELKWILGSTIQEVKLTVGNVRPGKENGHEHFGYLDGISQPNIQGIDKSPDPNPVEAPIPQGLILCKRGGDVIGPSTDPFPRPDWALDGSFMAFRYLTQNVPEFQAFIDAKNPPGAPQDFLGARLVGRWKSGAPIDLAPLHDDPALAADPIKINHFTFDAQSQERCPFAAHIRKTNPRGDFTPDVAEKRRILRRGIPFGPEVSPIEKQNQKTVLDRGLLFKCYQSQIGVGFQFLQQSWANNKGFPFGRTKIPTPGFDAIIGQAPNGGDRTMDISATNDPNSSLDLPVEWVISKGGEYFFSPSISALREVFALNPFVNGNGVHHENGNGHNGAHHPEL